MKQFKSATPVYPVSDVEKSIAWYQRALGFEAVYVNRDPDAEEPTNYAVLRRDEVSIHLMLKSEARPGFSGHVDAMFMVESVDQIYEHLRDRRIPVQEPPQDRSWGNRDLSLLDPDGNKIWLAHPLPK